MIRSLIWNVPTQSYMGDIQRHPQKRGLEPGRKRGAGDEKPGVGTEWSLATRTPVSLPETGPLSSLGNISFLPLR